MKSLKKIFKISLYTIILFLLLTLIFTSIDSLINYKTKNIIKLIIPILSVSFGGYKLGGVSEKNGWLEGIKFSLLIIFIMTCFTLLFGEFKIGYLVYLLLIAISGIFGSIIGINKKTKKY